MPPQADRSSIDSIGSLPAWMLNPLINMISMLPGGGEQLLTNASNYYNSPNSYVVSSTGIDWYGDWFSNGLNSSWIAAAPNMAANGNMTFSYNFDLTGYD